MSALRFSVRAPSNIALIKYMGKKDSSLNLPENGSISMTLSALCTVAEIVVEPGIEGFKWVAERPAGSPELTLQVPQLDEKGVSKLIRHAERVVVSAALIFARFGVALKTPVDSENERFTRVFRTANAFPQSSGIASSASSFAAITLVTALSCAEDPSAFEDVWKSNSAFRAEWAKISRQGSGSSCRSLDGPFVMWENEEVSVLPTRLPDLAHFVLLVSDQQKKVSSSEAHLRVKSSPLWEKRPLRVADRLAKMKAALAEGDLSEVARITWAESWEMHSLFHTCAEPFSYWEPATLVLLNELQPWIREPNPPVVTLDAGPNIHVIVEAARAAEWSNRLEEMLQRVARGARILQDRPGRGGAF